MPKPGLKCPRCLSYGQTVWVIRDARCPQCGTLVGSPRLPSENTATAEPHTTATYEQQPARDAPVALQPQLDDWEVVTSIPQTSSTTTQDNDPGVLWANTTPIDFATDLKPARPAFRYNDALDATPTKHSFNHPDLAPKYVSFTQRDEGPLRSDLAPVYMPFVSQNYTDVVPKKSYSSSIGNFNKPNFAPRFSTPWDDGRGYMPFTYGDHVSVEQTTDAAKYRSNEPPWRSRAPSVEFEVASSVASFHAEDTTNWGFRNEDGTWRCAYPGCQSQSTFGRASDLRKHYNRHLKTLFCRNERCPQGTEGGFSSKKDRARHEAKHNPTVGCEWDGCNRVFSRVDNMVRTTNTEFRNTEVHANATGRKIILKEYTNGQ